MWLDTHQPNPLEESEADPLEESSALEGAAARAHVNTPLGLLKKHQLWKMKAGRVVSHAFEHAEFNGAH